MSLKDEIFDYVMKTPENTNPNVLRSMLNNVEGGSSNVLVVNATIDMEHAESETEFPLILDKTMAEMLAVEYTVLVVDYYAGMYMFEFPELARVSTPDLVQIGWKGILGDSDAVANAYKINGGEMEATLTIQEEDEGSSVLIANATIAFEDLANLTPENPLTITINKTYDQMRNAGLSVIQVNIMQDGVVGATVVFSINVVADSELFYGSPLATLAIDIRNELAVIVRSSNDNTIAQLMALPNT